MLPGIHADCVTNACPVQQDAMLVSAISQATSPRGLNTMPMGDADSYNECAAYIKGKPPASSPTPTPVPQDGQYIFLNIY